MSFRAYFPAASGCAQVGLSLVGLDFEQLTMILISAEPSTVGVFLEVWRYIAIGVASLFLLWQMVAYVKGLYCSKHL